jgi:hypothetical protein
MLMMMMINKNKFDKMRKYEKNEIPIMPQPIV